MTIKHILPFILTVFLFSCQNDRIVKSIQSQRGEFLAVNTDSSTISDKGILSQIKPYKLKMDSVMGDVVAYSTREIYRNKPNGPLNNLVADILINVVNKSSHTKADFCLLNYGGLRRPIPSGEIKRSNIFQLMPFENEAVLVKLKPEAMQKLFKYLYFTNGQPVSNMKVYYKDTVLLSAKINNLPWDSTKSYWALTSDYTANGGDRMDFFAQRDSIIRTGLLIRNAIFDYLDSLQDNNLQLNADTTYRIFMQ